MNWLKINYYLRFICYDLITSNKYSGNDINIDFKDEYDFDIK